MIKFPNWVTILVFWLLFNAAPEHKFFYVLDHHISTNHMQIIRQAVESMNNQIGCVNFQEISYRNAKLINENVVLYIFSTDQLPGDMIGVTVTGPNPTTVLFSDHLRDKSPLSDEMYLKLTLHELAHVLGMPGHPHPFNDGHRSLLSLIIEKDAPARLFNRDVVYLKELICDRWPQLP